jgi:hypothetical protein
VFIVVKDKVVVVGFKRVVIRADSVVCAAIGCSAFVADKVVDAFIAVVAGIVVFRVVLVEFVVKIVTIPIVFEEAVTDLLNIFLKDSYQN